MEVGPRDGLQNEKVKMDQSKKGFRALRGPCGRCSGDGMDRALPDVIAMLDLGRVAEARQTAGTVK